MAIPMFDKDTQVSFGKAETTEQVTETELTSEEVGLLEFKVKDLTEKTFALEKEVNHLQEMANEKESEYTQSLKRIKSLAKSDMEREAAEGEDQHFFLTKCAEAEEDKVDEEDEEESSSVQGKDTGQNSTVLSKVDGENTNAASTNAKVTSRKSSPKFERAKVLIKQLRSIDKLKKFPDCLKEFEKIYDVWKKMLVSENSKNPEEKPSRAMNRRFTQQITNKDGAIMNFDPDFSQLQSENSVSPLETLISFLVVLENTPQQNKNVIKDKIYKNLASKNVEQTAEFLSRLEQQFNVPNSKANPRNGSYTPPRQPRIEWYPKFKKPKKKVKTIIKTPVFEVIPYNLRWMDKMMTKMFAGHHSQNNVGTQTDTGMGHQRSYMEDYSCVNIDSFSKEVNPYECDPKTNARLKSLNTHKTQMRLRSKKKNKHRVRSDVQSEGEELNDTGELSISKVSKAVYDHSHHGHSNFSKTNSHSKSNTNEPHRKGHSRRNKTLCESNFDSKLIYNDFSNRVNQEVQPQIDISTHKHSNSLLEDSPNKAALSRN